ncbi:hypothetical protein L1987_39509 [Smallanthus sonchifolius]|uniref:Uncharacterized protein n=1 Tax=Smallanthus sonchifolius TaxID=185202 RepID=A0ACB9HLJ9_9ASTR|nr:hypothetical protein L1987_39509 [Smallanthus sonchifolius]
MNNYPRTPPPFPPPNCPRCYSGNTKFCYYNNYSVSQPRYICKDCRRYWTHGGVIRNIPSNRKRARADCASSSSQISKPPPTTSWSYGHNHAIASARSSYGTFRPESLINGGGFCYQPPFMLNPNCEFNGGGVNAAFNVEFPQPSALMLPQFSTLNGVGIPLVQPPPPQLPTAWEGGLTNNNFLAIASAANVVSINEWSELKDNEDDPLQTYKPPSP